MRRFVIILSIILIFPFLLAACRSQPDAAGEPEITFEAEAEIQSDPELIILEPILEVISIVILQADIVVTEFEATLRITNPNEFAVALSELTYQLYGNGMFWAEGAGSGLLDIPPLESAQSAFRFNMNFINMNRRLLDDVINMREVNYRFRGQARVQPDLPNIGAFLMNYDCSGSSSVQQRERAENRNRQRYSRS